MSRYSKSEKLTKALAYNTVTRRKINIVSAIERHENDLATARSSPTEGGSSRGYQLQLTRRLHQARCELAQLPPGIDG